MSRKGFNDRKTVRTEQITKFKDVFFNPQEQQEERIKRTYLLPKSVAEAIRILSYQQNIYQSHVVEQSLLKTIPADVLEEAKTKVNKG